MKVKQIISPEGQSQVFNYLGFEIMFNGTFYFFVDFEGEEFISNSLENAQKCIDKWMAN